MSTDPPRDPSVPLRFPDLQRGRQETLDSLGGRLRRAMAERRPDAPETLLAAAQAEVATREEQAVQATWAEGPLPLRALRTCGHAALDRACLGCGYRFCPACQPEAAGTPCPRCAAPVWRTDETRPAEVPNPENGDY